MLVAGENLSISFISETVYSDSFCAAQQKNDAVRNLFVCSAQIALLVRVVSLNKCGICAYRHTTIVYGMHDLPTAGECMCRIGESVFQKIVRCTKITIVQRTKIG